MKKSFALIILFLMCFVSCACADVAINATNFPDANFRAYVSENFDTNHNGKLSSSEINSVTNLNVSSKDISSLKGIEHFTKVIILNCAGNNLKALDVSKNTALMYLYCNNNQLTAIDISKNTKLAGINCNSNKLTALNVTKNANLTVLGCSGNNISALDVTKCPQLSMLECADNKLTALDVTKNVNLVLLKVNNESTSNSAGNKLSALNVTKNTELIYLAFNGTMKAIDLSKNLKLKELYAGSSLTALDVSKCTALEKLYCQNNKLTTLNVSGCTALEHLDCQNNKIKALDVKASKNLKILRSGSNQLTSLNVSNNTLLEDLGLWENKIKTIDVTKNTALKQLNLDSNQVTSINVTKNTKLLELRLSGNKLTSLNVTNNKALKVLVCPDNQITALNVANNTKLENLECNNNRIAALDVSKMSALVNLQCSDNQIAALNVSSSTKLATFGCSNNKLKALDVTKNTKLTSLRCQENQIKTLDVTNNTKLVKLKCGKNKLTSLNVSKNTLLVELSCQKNQITALDVTKLTKLEILNCGGNALTALNVSKNTKLTRLDCYDNKLKALDITACTNLENLDCSGNQLSSLNVTKLTKLLTLECAGNQLSSVNLAKNTKLITLVCAGNSLSALDVTKCTQLKELHVQDNQIKTLDLSKNLKLEVLNCNGIPAALELSKNTALRVLDCRGTEVIAPDLSAYMASSSSRTLNLALADDTDTRYTWKLSKGSIPSGVTITSSDKGVTFKGKPKNANNANFSFTLTASDQYGQNAAVLFGMNIAGNIGGATLNKPYNYSVIAGGGKASYTLSISEGSLPTGIRFTKSGNKAMFIGTPTKAGRYTFTLKAVDASKKTATRAYVINVYAKPSFSGSFENGTLKGGYDDSLMINGGTQPFKCSISSGAIPDGLKFYALGNECIISGSPTKAGTFNFTVKAVDANGAAITKACTIKITSPAISGSLPSGELGMYYFGSLKVTGGQKSYSWNISNGSLPPGLKLSSLNALALIEGTPTQAGTYSFTLRVRDANGAVKTKALTVTIYDIENNVSSSGNAKKSERSSYESKNNGKNSENKDSVSVIHEYKPYDNLSLGSNGISESLTGLSVLSSDVVEAGSGKDSDLVTVKAYKPVTFIIGEWTQEVYDEKVYVDDKAANDIDISEENMFTLPAEMIHDDFKVSVKARAGDSELETEELYISAIE